MNDYLLECSKDAIDVDYSEILTADTEPSYWDCYDIAQARGYDYFSLSAEKLT